MSCREAENLRYMLPGKCAPSLNKPLRGRLSEASVCRDIASYWRAGWYRTFFGTNVKMLEISALLVVWG